MVTCLRLSVDMHSNKVISLAIDLPATGCATTTDVDARMAANKTENCIVISKRAGLLPKE